jgi:2-aminoadipate transaminase
MRLPNIQYVERPGLIDLGWGHPLPSALPVEPWIAAAATALRAYSWQSLTYGYAAGPGPLVEWIGDRLGRTDGRAPQAAEVFVTAGASQALELVSGVLTKPGDTVVVDSPTYHLALRVLADRDVRIVSAPTDGDGIEPSATGALLHRVRAPLLYLVPTFSNPTGASVPPQRRRALVDVAAATGTTIVEDDTYRELAYDGPAPPSLWSIAPGSGVIRLGSFSKTVGPGLRLGWLTAEPGFVRTLAGRGFIDSGGGLNHTTAFTMAAFGACGGYADHVRAIQQVYRRNRDALVAALRTELPALQVPVPNGGWFVWLRLPPGISATDLLAKAEARSVSFLTGSRFYAGSADDRHIRLSFSMYEPDLLAEAAHRLGRALRQALAAAGL